MEIREQTSNSLQFKFVLCVFGYRLPILVKDDKTTKNTIYEQRTYR